jgi:predicted  nucleic acid-binding Zn-ribbon protein
MGLFDSKTDPTTERFDALMEEMADLKRSVTELKGERAATSKIRDMEREYVDTKRQLTDLQIEFDKEKEKHAREKREVEHLVGLERKRSEFEREAAVTEAKVAVREENLSAEQQRFKDQMKFITDRFEKEIDQSKELMMEILARLPKVEALMKLQSGNGSKEPVGVE